MDFKLKKVFVAILFSITLAATTITGVAFDTVTVEAAHTHNYSRTATYRWDGYSSCKFDLTCTSCGKIVTKKAKITKKVVKKPTCTKDGKTKYEAKLSLGRYYFLVTKDKVVKMTGHKLSSKKTTKATFDKNGAITGKCSNCKKSVKTVIYGIASVELSNAVVRYDKTAHTPNVICKDTNGKVIDSKYYTVTVTDANGDSVSNPVEAGKYTVKVSFKTQYSGSTTVDFNISGDASAPDDKTPEIETPVVNESVRAYWTGYSSDYYYNQLGADEKVLYNKLDDMCFKLLTEDIDFESKNGVEVLPSVSVPMMQFSAVDKAVKAFCADNPQYYFLTNGVFSSSGGSGTTVYVYSTGGMSDGEYRLAVTAKVKNMLDEWVSEASKKSTDYDKLKSIHDSIIKRVDYNDPDGGNGYLDQTIAGIAIYNQCVCAGYTNAMGACSNKLGYKNVNAYSDDHAWNKIYIDGSWYVVDATWDDCNDAFWTPGAEGYYSYFLISDARVIQIDDRHYHYEVPVGEGLTSPAADHIYSDYPSSMAKWYR